MMKIDRLSLRFRLALIFAIGSLATLLVATSFLYWAFRREIKVRNRQVLEQKVEEIGFILIHHPDDRQALEEEILGEASARIGMGLWLRVTREDNPPLETPGMGEHLPPEILEGRNQIRRHHRRYLVLARTVNGAHIQAALDITGDEHLIDSYWHRLLYTLLLGVGGCATLGWWTAHRGLRPLRSLTETTRRITAHRTENRLAPHQFPPELRDLVQALQEMLDRLNRAYERLQRFSSNLAHEFRTPITVLMGEAEVTLSRERSDEDYRQVLESSLEEYRRLSRLISRMLFIARAEDPQLSIERVPVEGSRLAEEVLAYFEAPAAEQGVLLEGQGSGLLRGDPDLLRQALANLVSNALAATPAGGQVRIHVQVQDGLAGLRVEDTGCGIAPDEIPRIQDRFYRTREALDQKRPGTGLGLALVQSIAHLHGGDLQITSELERGTSARIQFPS